MMQRITNQPQLIPTLSYSSLSAAASRPPGDTDNAQLQWPHQATAKTVFLKGGLDFSFSFKAISSLASGGRVQSICDSSRATANDLTCF